MCSRSSRRLGGVNGDGRGGLDFDIAYRHDATWALSVVGERERMEETFGPGNWFLRANDYPSIEAVVSDVVSRKEQASRDRAARWSEYDDG